MTKRTTTTKQKAQKANQKDQGFLGIAPYEEKKGEEYMNANQLTHFRNLLNRWKQQLMEEADSTVYHMKEDAAYIQTHRPRQSGRRF